MPLKIGVTGGIGSGKSTVAKIFNSFGIPCFDSDQASKSLLDIPQIIECLTEVLGTSILDANHTIIRYVMGQLIFNNPNLLQGVNAILHPAVKELYENWLLQHHTAPYTLKEAAILFESGAYKQVDQIITINAPLELRKQRVMQRNGFTSQEVEARMSKQWTDEQRSQLSNYTISNDEQQSLLHQVYATHQQILNLKQ